MPTQPFLPALLMLLSLSACQPDPDDSGEPQETGNPDTGQADTGGTDTGESDDPCGESGICPLAVSDAEAQCGDEAVGSPRVLNATPDGPGALQITLENYQQGCCPAVEVFGEASQRTGTIGAWISLSEDDCACVCSLDISFRLAEIPSGPWSLQVEGEWLQVEVP